MQGFAKGAVELLGNNASHIYMSTVIVKLGIHEYIYIIGEYKATHTSKHSHVFNQLNNAGFIMDPSTVPTYIQAQSKLL